ncbi:hypothetical protein IKQ_05999 [Bacillus cereus VDM053]|nr:hypothetical protein IKQ_05999 [Bacillus cereus VDM053]
MKKPTNALQIRIEPWSDTDFTLLRRLNAPEMLEYLGGPESEEKILARQKHYVEIGETGSGRMFSIVLFPELEKVGNIGYWERDWQEKTVYEIGWGILPKFQGRGIATLATASARAEQKHKHIHAFPSIDNPASNAICQKLDFLLITECDFEYPPGSIMRCNNWCLDLNSTLLKTTNMDE